MPAPSEKPRERCAAQYLRVSTQMQADSLLGQAALIAGVAALEGLDIVRTYVDEGRSGLTLAGRPALQRLMADVLSGSAPYRVILVQDVSRWGRFQDADEAAHYEFLCRQAGVEIHYCAEAFGDTPTDASSLGAGLMKLVKRLMAAEFSRELSAKTRAAQRRGAAAGFKMGGQPGYGLRRMLLDAQGHPLRELAEGEQKHLADQRVVLRQGPAAEVAIVRKAFQLGCDPDLSCPDIAARLNTEGLLGPRERPWTALQIRRLLKNPRYAGVYVYGRTRQGLSARLGTDTEPAIQTPHLPAMIPEALFAAVQAARQSRVRRLDEVEMLRAARRRFKRRGRLTRDMLATDQSLPAARSYWLRFGPMPRLMGRLGCETRPTAPSAPRRLSSGYIDARAFWPETRVIGGPMSSKPSFTAFSAQTLLAAGSLSEVAPAAQAAIQRGAAQVLIFEDATGQVVDLDLRGDAEALRARLPTALEPTSPAASPGRGRPRLGVVPREVTLLPRHWEWLAKQPGGASAALRRLVEQASREAVEVDAARARQTAAYRAMTTLAGHLPGYEDALRALYAPDPTGFLAAMAPWPDHVRDYVTQLAGHDA